MWKEASSHPLTLVPKGTGALANLAAELADIIGTLGTPCNDLLGRRGGSE